MNWQYDFDTQLDPPVYNYYWDFRVRGSFINMVVRIWEDGEIYINHLGDEHVIPIELMKEIVGYAEKYIFLRQKEIR